MLGSVAPVELGQYAGKLEPGSARLLNATRTLIQVNGVLEGAPCLVQLPAGSLCDPSGESGRGAHGLGAETLGDLLQLQECIVRSGNIAIAQARQRECRDGVETLGRNLPRDAP
jgi:hypothetical protein